MHHDASHWNAPASTVRDTAAITQREELPMPAAIHPKLLGQLREALFKYTLESTLDFVLNDVGEKVTVRQIARNADYLTRCDDLIRWAENSGKLNLLCTGLQRHENTKGN